MIKLQVPEWVGRVDAKIGVGTSQMVWETVRPELQGWPICPGKQMLINVATTTWAPPKMSETRRMSFIDMFADLADRIGEYAEHPPRAMSMFTKKNLSA